MHIDNPNENYWQILAERRRMALVDTLEENKKLARDIEKLEEENRIYKEMLDETKLFVEVLQVMLAVYCTIVFYSKSLLMLCFISGTNRR